MQTTKRLMRASFKRACNESQHVFYAVCALSGIHFQLP